MYYGPHPSLFVFPEIGAKKLIDNFIFVISVFKEHVAKETEHSDGIAGLIAFLPVEQKLISPSIANFLPTLRSGLRNF